MVPSRRRPMHPPGYELIAELGRGTTGVVYHARDVRINRFVAIKIPLPCSEDERPGRYACFFNEARVLASIEHDHIASLFLVAEHDGVPFYAREYIDGSTLKALATAKAIDLRTGLRILNQVCEATDRVHERGFAHRNLRPSNVLVESPSRANRAKLIGFGRVGMLAGSPHLPLGATGTPPLADVQSIHQMLFWLAGTLGQSLPAELSHLGDTGTPAALAGALRRHI